MLKDSIHYIRFRELVNSVCQIFLKVLLRKKQRQSSGIVENLRPSLLMAANALAGSYFLTYHGIEHYHIVAIPTGNMDCDKNGSESSRSSEVLNPNQFDNSMASTPG